MEEEKDCLCGYPGYQQEGANSDSQHDERPEMMIIRLSDAVGGFDDAYGWFRGHNSYERIGIAALLGDAAEARRSGRMTRRLLKQST